MKIRPIAFVLPQFHPIPENDSWWGKGFTEWTNVTKAKPQFKGHYQPHLPTDLGFYDLRLAEARNSQADLAKKYGISGFCYYHYWFNGKRLLNQPIDEMLRLKEPDFPFMLCWANENWTRRWDGKEDQILIRQNYSFTDDINHMEWLCEKVFSDDRYIKVEGCPVFMVYRPDLFPDIKKTAELWRQIAKKHGFPDLYLIITESFNKINPSDINFNAAVEFSPHRILRKKIRKKILYKVLEKFGLRKKLKLRLADYKAGVQESLERELPVYKLYRSVTPGWDNTPRMQEKGTVCIGSSPELYGYWLKRQVKAFKPFSKEENFIFINAMNEWAEGNHLEPDMKNGLNYLKVTKEALSG